MARLVVAQGASRKFPSNLAAVAVRGKPNRVGVFKHGSESQSTGMRAGVNRTCGTLAGFPAKTML